MVEGPVVPFCTHPVLLTGTSPVLHGGAVGEQSAPLALRVLRQAGGDLSWSPQMNPVRPLPSSVVEMRWYCSQ